MTLDWAVKNSKTKEIIQGISEKELRILLQVRSSHLTNLCVFKVGWKEWKNASEVQFAKDDLFDPLVCPQLPPNFKAK